MNKIVVHRPGGFGQLKLETHASPEPADDEVRVSTRAVGVNYADCIVRLGLYKSAKEFVGWPITPGFEFAGVVNAVGASVRSVSVGDPVFGVSLFGAYASELVTKESFVRRMPAGLEMTQAATFPVAFLTAWYALRELARVSAGASVLVHSAAGGVGSALCQLARANGVRCFGVVGSAHKVAHATAQGASAVVDKSREQLWERAREFAPKGFDAIFDANGADTLRESYAHLKPMGRLVIYGYHTMRSHGGIPNPFKLVWQFLRTPRFNPLDMVNRNVAVMAFNLSYLFEHAPLYRTAMDELIGQLETGALTPLPVQEFPLARAADAHRQIQSGRTLGKLALIPTDAP
ncbi:MAG TPA: medium chain dehydrogenase/reductase family protein [Polyangiaceae bacterium]|nr:medium chain dehydrogenase/reductase family protein [Polyangiaceae bacterium]